MARISRHRMSYYWLFIALEVFPDRVGIFNECVIGRCFHSTVSGFTIPREYEIQRIWSSHQEVRWLSGGYKLDCGFKYTIFFKLFLNKVRVLARSNKNSKRLIFVQNCIRSSKVKVDGWSKTHYVFCNIEILFRFTNERSACTYVHFSRTMTNDLTTSSSTFTSIIVRHLRSEKSGM